MKSTSAKGFYGWRDALRDALQNLQSSQASAPAKTILDRPIQPHTDKSRTAN